MKRFILGLIVAISLPVMAAVLWPSGAYLETFQNGFIFGSGKVLSVLNDVITFDDKRLDDGSKQIIIQEDYEGSKRASDFTCGANLTATDETALPINGAISIDIDQGATPTTDGFGCSSSAYTLPIKAKGKFLGACIYTEWDGNDNEFSFRVFDNTNLAFLGSVGITASTEPKEHCLYFNSATDTASIDFFLVADTANNNTTLRLDDVQLVVDFLTPTDIYASSEWEDAGAITIGATTTAPTKPTTVNIDEVKWKRDGKDLIATYNYYAASAAGAAIGSGMYLFQLPSGLQMDSSLVNFRTVVSGDGPFDTQGATVLGSGFGNDTSPNIFLMDAIAYDTQNFVLSAVLVDNTTVNRVGIVGSAENPLTTLISFSVTVRIPIAGWSNTAQGVVVKNRTDSASVENVFSARIGSTGTVTSESVDFIEGDCANPSTGRLTCTLKAGFFTTAPHVSVTTTNTSTADIGASLLSTPTATTLDFNIRNYDGTGSGVNSGIEIIVQRQGTDYIKETDKVYTVDVSQLKGNTVRAEGNGSTVLTSDVTPIDFTEVSDSAGAWDGDEYTVQKNNSILKIVGSINYTASANREIRLYKNNSLYRQISDLVSSNPQIFVYTSGRGDFVAGDVLELRISTGSATTLTNSTIFHHITINETYGDKGVYLGSFGQPTCFVSDVKASGTNGGVAVIGDNVRDLNTTEGDCSFLSLSGGKFTLETGAYNIEASAIALRVDGHQARLRNFTDTVNSCIGSSEISLNGNNTATRSFIECRVVSIDPAKQYDIVHYLEANNGGLNQVLGRAVGAPTDEVYTQVKITKVR